MSLNREQVDLLSLPCVSIEKRKALPTVSAISFALSETGEVVSVGKTCRLRNRWVSHEQLPSLEAIGGVRIAWLDGGRGTDTQLRSLEGRFIERFACPLNKEVVIPRDSDLSSLSAWQASRESVENPSWEDYTRESRRGRGKP